MSKIPEKGRSFEQQIEELLVQLRVDFPLRFQFTRQPRIELHSGEYVIPDFEIVVDLPHVCSKYLIECQDRNRNSKTILHKIQHTRALSSRNKFIFVYNTTVSAETMRALHADGVLVHSRDDFTHFREQVRHTLRATTPPTSGGGDEWDEDVEQEE
jgi:hypothetical protein